MCKANREDHTLERNLGRTLAPDYDLLGGENKLTIGVQWNPVNKVTNGPKKILRINEVLVFFTRKCTGRLPERPKKSWP